MGGDEYEPISADQGVYVPIIRERSNSRGYSRPDYPLRSEFDRPREDLTVKVKPFNNWFNWFTYKIHFEADSTKACWSERTKCTL